MFASYFDETDIVDLGTEGAAPVTVALPDTDERGAESAT
jgi:hypothetical protein